MGNNSISKLLLQLYTLKMSTALIRISNKDSNLIKMQSLLNFKKKIKGNKLKQV